MPANTAERERLRSIKSFPSLVKYLRDDLNWPIESDDFEEISFDYTAEELGIDQKTAAKIQEIKQLRPLVTGQPWGIFFVKFEPKRLPVVALRRILSRLVVKKRESANKSDRAAWEQKDLLFISNYGEGEERQITFAHFNDNNDHDDLPTLKVLGWDDKDTALHLDHVHEELHSKLRWPDDDRAIEPWRQQWRGAFELKHREVITTSKQLAIRLAQLAQEIRSRCNAAMRIETENGPIRSLMSAFKQALIHDLDDDRFADMYAQTIAYGLLSARVSRPAHLVADNLADMVPVTNPFLKELMQTFLNVGGRKWNDQRGRLTGIDFDELGINDVVDTLRHANMEAVLRDFGNRNPAEDPVIHFYELFLKEYDADMRMQRGVFYTPRPVVSYIVRSVHELLQTEFGLADGLADTATWADMLKRNKYLKLPEVEVVDPKTRKVSKKPIAPNSPFVQILDPATGTATFLVEAVDLIHKTMAEKWKKQGDGDLWISQKWNDYVPKHLLPRLHGYELMMAPYAIAHMKIGLKLFETGYQFGSGERARIYLTNALEPAQDFSEQFEQMAPALAHEAQAVNQVKSFQRFTVVIGNPPYSGHAKNQGDWIRTLMRQTLNDGANGYFEVDGQPLGERNPKWINDDYVQFIRLSQSIISSTGVGALGFITAHGYLDNPTFRGMRQSLMLSFTNLAFLNLNGNSKRGTALLENETDENVFEIQQGVSIALMRRPVSPVDRCTVGYASAIGSREEKYRLLLKAGVTYTLLSPKPKFYLFIPQTSLNTAEFESAIGLKQMMPYSNTGLITSRDGFVTDFDKAELLKRLADFAKSKLEVAREQYGLVDVRERTLEESQRMVAAMRDVSEHIQPLQYRPFDNRELFYHHSLVRWPVYDLMKHMNRTDNIAIGTIRRSEVVGGWSHVFCVRGLAQHHTVSIKEVNYFFPLYLYDDNSLQAHGKQQRSANISNAFVKQIENATHLRWSLTRTSPDVLTPERIMFYTYALLYSPTYRARYDEQLKQDYPRILLPGGCELFSELSDLGHELASLHLLESPILNRPFAKYRGPSVPNVEKVVYSDTMVFLDTAETSGFSGVPENVWSFRIGGFQVCEKWLKDRKGRTLSKEDIEHYQKIVVAISETIRLMAEIDEVIEKHGGWPGAFVTTPAVADPAEPEEQQLPFA